MSTPFEWSEDTHDLTERGRSVTRRAGEAERKAVIETLGLISCAALTFSYVLKPQSEGRCRLEGTLSADLEQACVVSLEPVAARIEEEVAVEYWPAELLAGRETGGEHAILSGDEPEPLGPHGRIATGRLAFEVLSAALDPYPRKEGVEFDWSEGQGGETVERGNSPFAALKSLKLDPGKPGAK